MYIYCHCWLVDSLCWLMLTIHLFFFSLSVLSVLWKTPRLGNVFSPLSRCPLGWSCGSCWMPRDAGLQQRLEIAAVFQHIKVINVINVIKVKERGFLTLMLLMLSYVHFSPEAHRNHRRVIEHPVMHIRILWFRLISRSLRLDAELAGVQATAVVERM